MQNALGAILGKLEALERRNASLEREMATLRAERAASPAQPPHSVTRTGPAAIEAQPRQAGTVSRRTWLKRATGAAVASVAAGAMLERDTDTAAAHHGATNTVSADFVAAHYVYAAGKGIHGESSVQGNSATYGNNTNATGGYGVVGDAKGNGAGVLGRNPGYGGVGIRGEGGQSGVRGEGGHSGVWGKATGSAEGFGIIGEAYNGTHGTGVFGNGLDIGVHGTGKKGVYGRSGVSGSFGVHGVHSNGGHGVHGEGSGAAATGVWGKNPGGDAVRGEGKVGVRGLSSIAGAAAIVGEHSGSGTTSGYGGQFKGARAQVRLVPGATAGKPTSGTHAKGELYMDAAATLYVCTVGGTPGTWRRLTTTTA